MHAHARRLDERMTNVMIERLRIVWVAALASLTVFDTNIDIHRILVHKTEITRAWPAGFDARTRKIDLHQTQTPASRP